MRMAWNFKMEQSLINSEKHICLLDKKTICQNVHILLCSSVYNESKIPNRVMKEKPGDWKRDSEVIAHLATWTSHTWRPRVFFMHLSHACIKGKFSVRPWMWTLGALVSFREAYGRLAPTVLLWSWLHGYRDFHTAGICIYKLLFDQLHWISMSWQPVVVFYHTNRTKDCRLVEDIIQTDGG